MLAIEAGSILKRDQPTNEPLGTSGDVRRRLLRHYVPLALASSVVLVLFMTLAPFDTSKYAQGNIFTETFPQEAFPGQPGAAQGGPVSHGEGELPPEILEQIQQHGGSQAADIAPSAEEIEERSFSRRLTTSTGYVALGLLALTLLIGPANLLLRRRNPVSSYLRRDVGAWTAAFSVAHLIPAFQVHGTGQLTDFLDYFVVDGNVLTNSFGWGNWTGLGAVVIVLMLLAISSDFALRQLRARAWKWLQRLSYVLVALVILHSFFYGVLLRLTSPYTLLLGLSIAAILMGQVIGIRLWRQRKARAMITLGR